ncbi:uncharacterized protein MYCFIDRAFT_43180 [Pseudocercospora fijiensis CIRAD86]|uniref:MAPEG family protein n=1 Tax=Pseudocercospora fijiensis (strain CIRAD86) TaxID=383855 RepID=M2Z9H1_PSEFD|nr:uncharacterized protein MYCFIDRAFT_43180 [Pseudocercospora fijiensis CIRAD86]EME86480.1 hypothetical protein MYCFIDRAFT_43180 [Pseudocercospora fijiensis CIRAD86]
MAPALEYAPLNTALVGPVIALALWTFFMELWMYSYRIPDLEKYKVKVSPTMTVEDMNRPIPRHRQWPADNYNHLHEQPTVFYAVALALTFLQAVDGTSSTLAWAYVGARVVHSLVQASTNVIMTRFSLFALSSLLLFGLTLKGALVAFF